MTTATPVIAPVRLRKRPSTDYIKSAAEKAVQAVISTYTVARHGRPDLLLYYDGGIGDELLCTVVLRELRLRGRKNVWMRTRYPDLFRYNEDADRFVVGGFGLKWWTKRLHGEAIYPMYIILVEGTEYYLPPPCHIITRMCQLVGITGEITLKPYITLTQAESEVGKLVPNQVAIQSSGLNARFVHMNKQWYPDRFQAVVSAMKDRVNFVQIGSPTDPALEGVLDMRGKTTMRETAAILQQSQVFVGQVGFPMHLARAVDCRSVIVYGGKELPHQSGYTCNENIVRQLACSPCWRENECDYDRECMRLIHPGHVIEGIKRQLERYGTPLEVDTDTVPPLHPEAARMSISKEQLTDTTSVCPS